uniref:Wall-associated receptor kinase galacturonan-binding domain-containing protein n=2 Tax=Oryza brachyantha TaxID=4533 RepID=J3LX20_ORYBR
ASLLWVSVAELAAPLALGADLAPRPAAGGGNCSTACGGVEIPYLFGVEPGCALPGFELSCRDTADG